MRGEFDYERQDPNTLGHPQNYQRRIDEYPEKRRRVVFISDHVGFAGLDTKISIRPWMGPGEQHCVISFAMSETLPSQFLDLKKEIASTYLGFAESSSEAWNGILEQLKKVHVDIAKASSDLRSFV